MNTRQSLAWVAGLAVAAAAVAAEQTQAVKQAEDVKQAPAAHGDFVDATGRKVGRATLTQTPRGVLIVLDLTGLPPGEHGFHLHEVGKCEGATKFKTAGDHYAPQGRNEHGFHTTGGPHAGDMPNQFVAEGGRLRAHVLNERVTLVPGKVSLLDADGTSIVVHAAPDDYHTQPSGNSGDRIACAVIKKDR
jgi:superoxide dismutase, Cu-Zn family